MKESSQITISLMHGQFWAIRCRDGGLKQGADGIPHLFKTRAKARKYQSNWVPHTKWVVVSVSILERQ
jgi:hypothetical protein